MKSQYNYWNSSTLGALCRAHQGQHTRSSFLESSSTMSYSSESIISDKNIVDCSSSLAITNSEKNPVLYMEQLTEVL